MKNNFIVFVGPVNKGNVPTGGQIAKSQYIVDYFERSGIEYKIIDSCCKKKVTIFFHVILESFKNRDCKILLNLGSRSALYLAIGLMFSFSLKRTGYLIIGNWFPVFLKKRRYLKFIYNKFLFLNIEGKRSADALVKLGLTRVLPFPNFKKMYDVKVHDRFVSLDGIKSLKILFLARVCEDKGIDIAVEAIEMVNRSMSVNMVIELDIYGKVDDAYEVEFYKKLRNTNYINYKGLMDLSSIEGYNKLVNEGYYLMIFPTKYIGEGFAGTFLDSMILGLPVVASDWNLNSEVIVNNSHGLIMDENNPESLMESIVTLIVYLEDRNRMARQQYARKHLYDVDLIMSDILEQFNTN